jgi:hypothetical protein
VSRFALDIERFAKKTGIALDRAVRMIVIEVGSSIIRMTPVDTGRLKGEWQFTIQPAAIPTGREDKDQSGATTAARLTAGSIEFRAGMVGYITNLMPYAIPIELGHSKVKSPQGMVRITLERFQQIVNKAIQEHKV